MPVKPDGHFFGAPLQKIGKIGVTKNRKNRGQIPIILAVLQTARNTYLKALLPHLKDVPEQSTPLQ